MGTTLATLNVYNASRESLAPLLAATDLLRDQNAPWLTVVPKYGETEVSFRRLEKLAKKLTKNPGVFALVFYYFDDDVFSCDLFAGGKKVASCESNQSWAKMGKKLGECFGDDAPSRAFRFVSKCGNLEEQLKLFEETVGTALFELQEEVPRRVERCDKTLKEIKAREAALRKRANRFKLTELPEAEWPEEQKYRQRLLAFLRQDWEEYNAAAVLYETDISRYLVPNADGLFAYPYFADWNTGDTNLLLLNAKTGEAAEVYSFSGTVRNTVWRTEGGATAVLLFRTDSGGTSFFGVSRRQVYSVECFSPDGEVTWRFEPQHSMFQAVEHVHSSRDGVITLFAAGVDSAVKADALVWQIDGEAGKLIRACRFPYSDDVCQMVYAEGLNAFLVYRQSEGELILLSESLEEIRRIKGFDENRYFSGNNLCGNVLWLGDLWDNRSVYFYGLEDGTVRKTTLEVAADPVRVLSDGRILGVNERQNNLYVFDGNGLVAARCAVPGKICRVVEDGGRVFVVEIRAPETHGFISDEVFDATSFHVWRLDAESQPD